MNWQNEMDKGAAESARAAAEWHREHSFGAYARRFLTTVVETGVGSFSSAFLGAVGSELADEATKAIFRDSGSDPRYGPDMTLSQASRAWRP